MTENAKLNSDYNLRAGHHAICSIDPSLQFKLENYACRKFYDPGYGFCSFSLIKNKKDIQNKIISICQKNQEYFLQSEEMQFLLCAYEIFSEKNVLLGVVVITHNKNESEIFILIKKKYVRSQFQYNLHAHFIDYIFEKKLFKKLVFHVVDQNFSMPDLHKLGYTRQNHDSNNNSRDIIFEISQYDRALAIISDIIIKENNHLASDAQNLASTEAERVRELWCSYFRRGIPFSNGGVEYSIIGFHDICNKQNFESFCTYRPDRPESVRLSQEKIKNFLIEETIIKNSHLSEDLYMAFCMGSHEGFSRLLRCIYHGQQNNGIFYPFGSYSLMAYTAACMRPCNYNIHFVKTKPNSGKISPKHLLSLCLQHPSSKVLFLDIKTTAGALYTEDEVEAIIKICQEKNIFIIFDIAHIHMELGERKFPDIITSCNKLKYNDYVIIFTTSKTYGLERARVGFLIINKKNNFVKANIIEDDFTRTFGSTTDLPVEVAYTLFNVPLVKRLGYLEKRREQYFFNMNLLVAYIEGIKSQNIDKKFLNRIEREIDVRYQEGVEGIDIEYIPDAGMHMVLNMEGLKKLYFSNIRIFNSEIFSYILHAFGKVVTLHAHQILDPRGYSLRVSFSNKEHIHASMIAMHDLIKLLTLKPEKNRFMLDVESAEAYIFSDVSQEKKSYDLSYEL